MKAEPVHGAARRHVFEHGPDGRGLIGGFLKGEAFGKRFVVGGRHLEGKARTALTQGVEVQQFRRRVAHLFRGFFLGLLPVASPERMERRVFGVGAAVARNQVQIRNGYEELRFVFVFQLQKFGFSLVRRHLFESEITADPVLQVDDRVAHLEFGDVANEHLDVRRLRAAAKPRAAGTRRIEFRFGEKRDLWVVYARALIKRARRKPHQGVGREKVVKGFEFGEVEARGSEEVGHRPLTPHGGGEQQNALTPHTARLREVEQRLHGVLALSVDRDALEILGRTLFDAADRKAREGR